MLLYLLFSPLNGLRFMSKVYGVKHKMFCVFCIEWIDVSEFTLFEYQKPWVLKYTIMNIAANTDHFYLCVTSNDLFLIRACHFKNSCCASVGGF